jgi:hypothetical protein
VDGDLVLAEGCHRSCGVYESGVAPFSLRLVEVAPWTVYSEFPALRGEIAA